MTTTTFHSTAIVRADYDESTRKLRIWFTSSSEPYDYEDVPPEVFEGLCRAGSAGAFFNDNIREQYRP